MFDQVTIRLLEGKFICESTAPEAFRWLNSEESRQDVAAYLDRIGRRLTKTPNGVAYYAIWKRVGSDERSEVKRVFANIKQMIRPLIHFINLCMEVEKKDSSPAAGDRLDYAVLLKAVTENPISLRCCANSRRWGRNSRSPTHQRRGCWTRSSSKWKAGAT